jgi:hypothetical protein
LNRSIRRSPLWASLALAAIVGTLHAAPPAAPAPRTFKIEYEDGALPARQKELLARYADQIVSWATEQRLVKAAEEQSARQATLDRIRQIDRAWQRGEDPDGLATNLGTNDCAKALLSMLGGSHGFGEAFVTDSQGALVCMTRRTSDYWQGDEAKWSRAWNGGTGAVFVSRVAHDDSTGKDLMHISVPLRAGRRLVGVLTVGRLLAPS